MDKVELSAEAKALFQEGISLVLSIWPSLRLAVENEWGGRNSREKAQKIASDVFTWFTQTKDELYVDDLEDKLDDAMYLSLGTGVDDDTIETVAEDLMSMHKECLGGNYDSVKKFREYMSRAKPVRHVRQMEDDDDDDMMVDATETKTNQVSVQAAKVEFNSLTAAEAEDGRTTVSPRKNRGRRN